MTVSSHCVFYCLLDTTIHHFSDLIYILSFFKASWWPTVDWRPSCLGSWNKFPLWCPCENRYVLIDGNICMDAPVLWLYFSGLWFIFGCISCFRGLDHLCFRQGGNGSVVAAGAVEAGFCLHWWVVVDSRGIFDACKRIPFQAYLVRWVPWGGGVSLSYALIWCRQPCCNLVLVIVCRRRWLPSWWVGWIVPWWNCIHSHRFFPNRQWSC